MHCKSLKKTELWKEREKKKKETAKWSRMAFRSVATNL